MKKQLIPTLAAAGITLASSAWAGNPVDVHILSATVRDQTIQGAEVLLQKNGEQTVRGVSDAQGHVQISSPTFSADEAGAMLIVKKDGYSTLVARCPCNNLSYAISPVMQQLDGLRVVLSWGATPADLDGHLGFENNHIWYISQHGPDAGLDVDQRQGYGPETITIQSRHWGSRYVYAVHDFSDKDLHGSNALELSQARVMVYIGQTLIRTYYPDPRQAGNLWTVFAINGNGDFEDINRYSDMDDPYRVVDPQPSVAPTSSPAASIAPTAANLSHAIAFNRDGEAAYHRQDYDIAIRLFQQAIDLYPDYGQAYSNLGLTFERAHNEAEAIWANRKALALASGPDAPRVRASTYYNIARIYESRGEWHYALESYQSAEQQQHNDVYTSAIARMKDKLK